MFSSIAIYIDYAVYIVFLSIENVALVFSVMKMFMQHIDYPEDVLSFFRIWYMNRTV